MHTQDASYLDVIHTEAPDEWNPSDYAYHLTRRARGLALWFSLAVNGTDAYRDAVEAALAMAREAAATSPTTGPQLVRQPELSVVLFRRKGGRPSDYDRWSPHCWPTRSASSPLPSGKERRWPASPSFTQRRPVRSWPRSSTPWPNK